MSTTYGLDFQIWVKDNNSALRVLNTIRHLWKLSESDYKWEGQPILVNDRFVGVSGTEGHYWISGYGEMDKTGWDEFEEIPAMAKAIEGAAGEPVKTTITIKYIEQTPSETYHFGPGHEEEEIDDEEDRAFDEALAAQEREHEEQLAAIAAGLDGSPGTKND